MYVKEVSVDRMLYGMDKKKQPSDIDILSDSSYVVFDRLDSYR